MEYKIERNDTPKKADKIDVMIGLTKYRLTETIDGKLEIMKITEESDENLMIHPKVGNVIDLK